MHVMHGVNIMLEESASIHPCREEPVMMLSILLDLVEYSGASILPKAMMHPLFQIPPIFLTPWKILTNLLFPKKFQFVSVKISDDLFYFALNFHVEGMWTSTRGENTHVHKGGKNLDFLVDVINGLPVPLM